jgi:hypothetical protein
LSLQLEKGGSITITKGGYLDLDRFCSRSWIVTNKDFNLLLTKKAIRVVLDSRTVIPNMVTIVKPAQEVIPVTKSALSVEPTPSFVVKEEKVPAVVEEKKPEIEVQPEPSFNRYMASKLAEEVTTPKESKQDRVEEIEDPIEKLIEEANEDTIEVTNIDARTKVITAASFKKKSKKER